MGKALESLKKLQLRNEQIKSAHPVVVKPKQLIDLATKLSRVVNNVKDIPASQTIEMLFEKAKNIYLFEDGSFTAREKRNLPFILPSSRPISGMVDFVFENIDFQRLSSETQGSAFNLVQQLRFGLSTIHFHNLNTVVGR